MKAATVPNFWLYGEASATRDAEFVHIEDIESRSAPRLWEIDSHTHRGLFQLVFVLEGGALASLDGQPLTIEPPSVLVVPSATIHAFQFQPGTRGYVLTLAEAMLFDDAGAAIREPVEALFLAPRVVSLAGGETATDIDALLGQVAREFRGEAPGRSILVDWLVRAVLLRIARRHVRESQPAGAGRRRAENFARFRQLLETHHREHWTVPQYASALSLTEGRLNRLCRALGGASAAELILDRLLLEARRRLIYVAAPVSQIAYDLGYQDPAYFCRIFKKRVGMTPRAFRAVKSAVPPAPTFEPG
jgi:AraC family transcriptional activator of pobA